MLRGSGSADIASGTTPASFSTVTLAAGTANPPSLAFAGSLTTGWYQRSANLWTWSNQGVGGFEFNGGQFSIIASNNIGFLSGGISTSMDSCILRNAANSLRFGLSTATTTSRTEMNKSVTAIANAVATDVLTVTIPNAAHSASMLVSVTSSLGAGGAIGANEATCVNEYLLAITRTAGVATTVAISSAFGAAATAVAGAATVTGTATVTAMTGAVGATQTFTVQVTISRSTGSSTNHTCLVYARLMNANATGITVA